MKLLVFSDSHSDTRKMKEAIDMHARTCDGVVFLGDGLRDAEYLKDNYMDIPFFCVKGNCDFFAKDAENERVLYFDGFKILITHGHAYGVKGGIGNLLYRARELEADAVFFGHTHVPCEESIEIAGKRIQLFNPGSIGHGGSFGVVNTSGKVLVLSHGKIL